MSPMEDTSSSNVIKKRGEHIHLCHRYDNSAMSSTCTFSTLQDGLTRDKIVCGIFSDAMWERLLREYDLTLDKAISMCIASDLSKLHVEAMKGHAGSMDVNVIHKGLYAHCRKVNKSRGHHRGNNRRGQTHMYMLQNKNTHTGNVPPGGWSVHLAS